MQKPVNIDNQQSNEQTQYIPPTIAAIATPIGRGGIGVIRLSGQRALEIAMQLTHQPTHQHLIKKQTPEKQATDTPLTGKQHSKQPKKQFIPRHAHFCRFYTADGRVIDEGIVLYFPAPHSFTGEDVIELQGHGGMVLQNMLLARLFALGAKQANAGEFSYRAFENDKLDLVQAEAIADLIDASSEMAAVSAMRSLTGEFSTLVNELLERLTNLRLYVEASIDFPDEEDVGFLSDGVIETKLNQLQNTLLDILTTAKQGSLVRDGIHVVIAGRPNAGKSSLLNQLAKQDRAIVTDIAGTTRDTLKETVILNGLTLHLTDTAGLRDTTDKVERIGIERAKQAIEQADIVLMVMDLTTDADPLKLAVELFGQQSLQTLQKNQWQRLLVVGNKYDLIKNTTVDRVDETLTSQKNQNVSCETLATETLRLNDTGFPQPLNISCATAEGIPSLVTALCDKVGYQPSENTLISRTRHLDALQRTQSHLSDAYQQLTVYQAGELVAESLRLAQQNLGEITGEFSADDLLGKIFADFCIGK